MVTLTYQGLATNPYNLLNHMSTFSVCRLTHKHITLRILTQTFITNFYLLFFIHSFIHDHYIQYNTVKRKIFTVKCSLEKEDATQCKILKYACYKSKEKETNIEAWWQHPN